jgi:hypothetical protein
MEVRKQRGTGGNLKQDTAPKNIPLVTYFLQPGPTY